MSRPLWAAWLRGMDAGLAGEPLEECPYKDKRKPSGRLTWSRAFWNAWRDGWTYATKDREQALITSQYRAYPGPYWDTTVLARNAR